jgi:hypothetical protein
MNYNGQVQQDRFILSILKQKRNGFFVEIGSHEPIYINNTYKLEKEFDWKGIMIEFDQRFLPLYKEHRPNSIHVINDATQIDYRDVFLKSDAPSNIDYLQIDLEVENSSTIKTLQLLDSQIFDNYKFATVTFEHDIYRGDYFSTRSLSREIFGRRGYVHVFTDVNHKNFPFEDWYVHPDLVDINHVNQIKALNVKNYENHPITDQTISWDKIEY